METITDKEGTSYKILEIYDKIWAVVYKTKVGNSLMMNAIHITTKSKANLVLRNGRCIVINTVNLQKPEVYNEWNARIEQFKKKKK